MFVMAPIFSIKLFKTGDNMRFQALGVPKFDLVVQYLVK